MTTGVSESSPLVAFSNTLADLVAQSGQFIVALNGQRRRPSSGVHWRSGLIVTADHAINREEGITVTLPDDRTLPANLVGRDPGTDLAVLQIADVDFATAPLADHSTTKVGHMVMAIARSYENGVSASLGVISSLGGSWRSWQGGRIDQFIRPSLMLYPGFSGGALIDAQGKVLGINTTGPRHMALTIPTTTVNRVVNYLISGGRMARGYMGVGLQSVPLTEALRRSLNLANERGVIVLSLEPDAAAEQAGLMIGDILVAMDGVSIQDVSDVHAMLEPERVGQPLTTQLIRGGALISVEIIVGERPGREV